MTDPSGPQGRKLVPWLVTLAILGVMVFMSVNRALVEEHKPVHHSHEAPSPSGH